MPATAENTPKQGPLVGTRIIEMAGIGPAPFCGMLLADLGAEVIRIDRKSSTPRRDGDNFASVTDRGKKSIALNLKKEAAIEAVLQLTGQADALIEGFRPGVMERLGLGPERLLQHNPALVFGRMTGWGQDGPLSSVAGHDLNYIAISGALGAMGRKGEPPFPPLNLIGDYGGGGMLLAVGLLAAILNARQSGKGQIVDAAMTDGTAVLMAMIYGMQAAGFWQIGQQSNLLDGAAHFYDTYRCSDGRFISLGSIEPQFYALLREKLELKEDFWDGQMDRENWPQRKKKLATLFARRSRNEWCELMEGTDICFAPVLDMDEAPLHPHNQARATFVPIADAKGSQAGWQPAPAPRFSATPGAITSPPPNPGHDTDTIIEQFGLDGEQLKSSGAVS